MVLVNGQHCDLISVFDRGLNYGDGVFRTLRLESGIALNWVRQYRKLATDCSALGIIPPDRGILEMEIATITKTTPDCVLKIIVTRGSTGRGYGPCQGAESNRVIMTSPAPAYPDEYYKFGVKTRLCNIKLAAQPALAGIKHLNRLENVLARNEWNGAGIAEGLVQDYDGNIIEGTMTNIFTVSGGSLFTPDLSRCGVAGVQRERVIEFAGAHNIKCGVKNLGIDDVVKSDEVFLVNSVVGLWQVREFFGRKWDVSLALISPSLRRWLDDRTD